MQPNFLSFHSLLQYLFVFIIFLSIHMFKSIGLLVRNQGFIPKQYFGSKKFGIKSVTKSKSSLFAGTNISFQEEPNKQVRLPSKGFKSFPFSYHEEIEIKIDSITNLGLGVGKYSLNDGQQWVVMVPTTLPGEVVRCKIYKNHASYSEADLVEVKAPSSDRVVPPCPYFEECGGCQYQHMTLESQREWKQRQVHYMLSRIGQFDEASFKVEPVISSAHQYGYRSKLTPHYELPILPNELKIGFQKRGTHSVIDIDRCIIASPRVNERYAILRENLKESIRQNPLKRGGSLLLREGDAGYITTNSNEMLRQTVHGMVFEYRAGEFFQNNPYVLPLMIDYVISEIKGPLDDCDTLVDTYCGSGLFSICAAKYFDKVFGVEVSALAIEAAKANAKRNEIQNIEYLCGNSERIFEKLINKVDSSKTAVIIDPPRKGCDDAFLRQLFEFSPKRLVYVSCDPATQARDAKDIVAAGYTMKEITPFDLFPQTRHIENVITFDRTV